jgi:translation initiation factor 3 subunit L
MVDVSFPRLTERLFRGAAWPAAAAVAPFVDGDAVFLMLYSELRFRHMHASLSPSFGDRAAAWANYKDLFGVALSAALNVRLPPSWLWDMVDEYCYQFQAFHAAAARAVARGGADAADAAAAAAAWPVADTVALLQSLADRAALSAELSTPAGVRAFCDADAGSGPDGHGSNVLRGLGYFSHIGVCRLKVLLAQYEPALRALGPVNPAVPDGLFAARVAGATISLHYYSGFAYLALTRYVDAARTLDAVLAHIARVKQFHARSAAHDQILKKNEQCAALLALALALCPAAASAVSDAGLATLRDKHGDKLARMARATDAAYEDLYAYGCPKFVPTAGGLAPVAPSAAAGGGGDDGGPANAAQAAYRAQLASFLAVVHSRRLLPPLRQLLRLYTRASVPKLAGLMEATEAEVGDALDALAAAQSCITWTGAGGAADGEPTPAVDVEFRVETDADTGERVVCVEPARGAGAARAGGVDALLRHVTAMAGVVRDLAALPPVKAA